MDKQLKSNIGSIEIWMRLAYMLVFSIILYCALLVFSVAVLIQFLFVLITSKKHIRMARFIDILCQYMSECFRFIGFDSEQKPFPFSDFPESDIVEPFETEVSDVSETVDVTETTDVTGTTDATETREVITEAEVLDNESGELITDVEVVDDSASPDDAVDDKPAIKN